MLAASQAHAQPASNSEQEIAFLKQQLRLLEQELDKLQKQTAANTEAAARAKSEAKAEAGSAVRTAIANANAAIPVKGAVAPSAVVVTMPNNRPTICTADDQNCISIVSRVHRHRHRGRTADGLHRDAQLVCQRQPPLHARLSAW